MDVPFRSARSITFATIRRGSAIVGGGGIAVLALISVADAVGRSLFAAPLLGQVELGRVLLAWIAFSALAEAEHRGENVRLRLVESLRSSRARRAIASLGRILALAAAAWVAIAAALAASSSWSSAERLIAPITIPTWHAKLAIVFGFVLASLELRRGSGGSSWTRS